MSLPGVSIRADELKPVLEILQSDKYDSPEKMGRAILQAAYESFAERDWHLVAMRMDGHNLLYGLYGTSNAAQKALENNDLALFGECAVFSMQSVEKRKTYLKEHLGKQPDKRFCRTCGHAAGGHGVYSNKPGCADRRCGCKAFVMEGK